MNEQIFALMQRRSELLIRISAQREQANEIGSQLKTPLALVNMGWGVARFLRSKPMLIAGVVALFVIRRRGSIGLVKGAWRLWKNYGQLSAFSAKLSSRP